MAAGLLHTVVDSDEIFTVLLDEEYEHRIITKV